MQSDYVHPDQAWLDAQVAEAAEAWLSAPSDVAAYARLVAAAEQRRSWLGRPGPARATRDEAVRGRATGQEGADPTEPADDADRPADDADEGWPAVRTVGADLVGDPVAVLRRLRGG